MEQVVEREADDGARRRPLGETAFVTLPEWILGTLMLVGVAITFANVIGRYVFGVAIYWAEEILVFLLVWGVFVGLVAVTYKGDYLSMDLFSSRLSGRPRRVLSALIAVTLVVCCAYVATRSWRVVLLFIANDQRTVSAQIPKAIPHAALVVGFSVVPIVVLIRWRAWLTGRFQ